MMHQIDRDQELFESAREYAKYHCVDKNGKPFKFATLILQNHSYKRIAGIETMNPIQHYDTIKRKETFQIQIVGGELNFTKSNERGGALSDKILLSSWNKRFLASHYGQGIFEIEEKDVDREIKKLRDKMIKELVIKDTPERAEILEKIKVVGKKLNFCNLDQAPALRQEYNELVTQSYKMFGDKLPEKQTSDMIVVDFDMGDDKPEKSEKPPKKVSEVVTVE